VSDATRRSHLPLFDESKRHKHVKKFPLSSLFSSSFFGTRAIGCSVAVLKPVITEEPVTQTIQGTRFFSNAFGGPGRRLPGRTVWNALLNRKERRKIVA
jgi:hypothetical protein